MSRSKDLLEAQDYSKLLRGNTSGLEAKDYNLVNLDEIVGNFRDFLVDVAAAQVCAQLVEIRGDWSMFKSVLGLPGWQQNGPICWKCNMDKHNLHDVSLDAAWRNIFLSHDQFLARQRGLPAPWLSSCFDIPFVTIDSIKIDFLHTADLGCTADFLGNFFWYITFFKVNAGRGSHRDRCNIFFKDHVLPFYQSQDIQDKLPFLRPTMLKKEKGTYKLRAKAGEARALVGVVNQLVRQFLDRSIEVERAMGFTGQSLTQVYDCLHSQRFSRDNFQSSIHNFLKGLAWLARYHENRGDTQSWRLKPKTHLLAELGREGINPTQTWCYRDESWGGDMSHLAERRGGHFTMLAVSRSLLSRFTAQEPFPRL